jgi:hypothetical protein
LPQSSNGAALALNVTCAVLCVAGGATVLVWATPLLLDWQHAESVLVVLPSLYAGFPPWVKVTAFSALVAASAAALAWGGWSAVRPRTQRTTTVNLVLATTVILFVICAEAAARISIALDMAPLNSPDYYANPSCGDDNFKMKGPDAATAVANDTYHRLLGWTGQRTPDKPDGRAWPPRIDGRPKMVFYGDSFMRGTVGPSQSIPALVEAATPSRQALSYAVAGYGVDQIWLRYMLQADRIPEDTPVVFGVLTVDLDRSAMRYRGALKPVYQPVGGSFELAGVPPPRDVAAWLRDNPPGVKSYGLALLGAAAELLVTGFDRSEVECDRATKLAVNRFILEGARKKARSRRHRLVWVLFVPQASFYKPSDWRYDFLRDYFASTGLPTVDALIAIRQAAAKSGADPMDFFIPKDGHLNARGNAAVAAAVVDALAR